MSVLFDNRTILANFNTTKRLSGNFHFVMSVFHCIMEYGSTPYVGLTRKKHGRHTLAQILFSSEN